MIDLGIESKEKIFGDGKAGLLEIILREGERRDFCNFLDKHEPEISMLISNSSYGSQIILYMMDRDKHSPEQILEKMHNLDSKLKQDIMSGLKRVIRESEQQGIQLGEKRILERLVKAGFIRKADAEKILKNGKEK